MLLRTSDIYMPLPEKKSMLQREDFVLPLGTSLLQAAESETIFIVDLLQRFFPFLVVESQNKEIGFVFALN